MKTSAPTPGASPIRSSRAYRIDVLLDDVPELAGMELMQRIADLLVEEGLATREGGPFRAVMLMQPYTWTNDLPGALHAIVPRAVPQSPDLGLGYSPN